MIFHRGPSIAKYNVCLEMKTKRCVSSSMYVFLFSFVKENLSLRESFNFCDAA